MMASILLVAAQARASWYDITFVGGGSAASGQIDVVGNDATSGYLTITSGGNSGTYNLLPGSWFPSPNGYFNADNKVFVGADPFLDVYGLIFTGGGIEINLWGNGSPGSSYYTLYGAPPAWTPQVDSGRATLTAVPEPTTIISGALMLLPFGASTLRILRRREVA